MTEKNNFLKSILKKVLDIKDSNILKHPKSRKTKNSPRKLYAIRSICVVVAIAIAFGCCVFQLARIQIIHAEEYRQIAEQNQLYDKPIPAKRGDILDRNGNVLAQSASVWKVYADPYNIPTQNVREELTNDLVKALSERNAEKKEKKNLERKIYKILGKKDKRYLILKNNVEYNLKENVLKDVIAKDYKYTIEVDGVKKEKTINGSMVIGIVPDVKRYYPNNDFASHVLGYTNSDGVGSAGVEFSYNNILMGKPGRIVTAKGIDKEMMPLQHKEIYEAKQGKSIILTIDRNIQMYLEKALDQAYIDNKCASANGIVMDVNTGAILAMATKSSFNPNNPWEVDDKEADSEYHRILSELEEKDKKNKIEIDAKQMEERKKAAYNQAISNVMFKNVRNINISDTYEPGSVFKTITACAALEEGVATPDTKVECKPGGITIAGNTYHCANRRVHGVLDMTGGLTKSCNSYFITMGQKIGVEAFNKYFEAFGFTEKTEIDLPAEAKPIMGTTYHNPATMSKVNLASSSFGQTFQVTPIQMVTALSAIANGGKLMKPYIVEKTADETGRLLTQTKPVVRRQVISQKTSDLVSEMMRKVVNEGTAKNGYVAGYRVAGKTGTSQKLSKKKGEYIASYGCFAPADDAKIAVIIMIDEPHGGQIHGGQIAAPVAARVVEDTLKYMNVEPIYTETEIKKLDTVIPSYIGKDARDIKRELVSKGFNCKIMGNGTKIVKQIPAPYQTVPQGGIIVLYTQENPANSKTTIPDFTNLTLAQANQRAAAFGLNLKISGNTLVNSELIAYGQNKQAGKEVEYGTTITVYFKSNTGVSDLGN